MIWKNTEAVHDEADKNDPAVETHEQSITREARENGFDLNAPLFTKDGDSVRIVGFDHANRFGWPIIGEITDTEVSFDGIKGTSTRLAKFDTTGAIWAATPSAREKHSLQRNLIKWHRRQPKPESEVLELESIIYQVQMTQPGKNKVKITHLKLPEPIYLDKGVTLSLINTQARAIK
jgi:hypothetical protein